MTVPASITVDWERAGLKVRRAMKQYEERRCGRWPGGQCLRTCAFAAPELIHSTSLHCCTIAWAANSVFELFAEKTISHSMKYSSEKSQHLHLKKK